MGLKTVAYTVRAGELQAARWRRDASGQGFRSVGAWLTHAADAYLAMRNRPVPLAWRRGWFSVELDGGAVIRLAGHTSPPFAIFRGCQEGPDVHSQRRFSLVFMPGRRIIATLRSYSQCKALAAELAVEWARHGGEEPPAHDPAPIVAKHLRESL